MNISSDDIYKKISWAIDELNTEANRERIVNDLIDLVKESDPHLVFGKDYEIELINDKYGLSLIEIKINGSVIQLKRPKAYTVKEVYSLLGLEDPIVFLHKQKEQRLKMLEDPNYSHLRNNKEFIHRCTGKSTYLIIQAVVLSQTNRVSLTAENRENSLRLINRAKEICRQLGLDEGNILYASPEWPDHILGCQDVIHLYDRRYSYPFLIYDLHS
jgi:hypothetical protein